MNFRFKRTKCNCKECPLAGQKKVLGIAGFEKPKVAIIGEAPGENEDREGQPFVGAAGARLKGAVAQSGMIWHTVYKTNVLLCRPPNNEIDSVEGRVALECCAPGFKEEVEWMEKQGIRVLVPTGNTALGALGIEGKIGKVRGSVYEVGKIVAVPTYHPSFILRGMWKEEPTWINDFIKARDVSLRKWKKPKEKFNIFPKVKDVEDFVDEVLREKKLVGVDLETTGFNEYYAKILMVGLAKSPEEAIVVPFLKKGGLEYWNSKDKIRVDRALRRLFKDGRLVFQNAMFDVKHLLAKGYKVGGIAEDTMLLHNQINPELPHNLGYIVSIYGETPFWKDVVLGSEDRMVNMDDEVIRTYNARDAVVLLQVLPGLLKHIREVGTEHIYRDVSLKLILPLLDMTMTGLPIDRKKMEAKGRKFKRDAEKAEKILRETLSLPAAFNFASGDHMRLLIWGEKPKALSRILAEKAEIDGNPKKRKDTKKYQELVSRLSVYEGVKPLYRTNATASRTESGAIAVDEDALLRIQRAALQRKEAMGYIARRTARHDQEERDIERLLLFIREFGKYNEAAKLASTFTGFPIGPDGRVHPSYKIHGAATGRLSSADPNAQNIPHEVQDVFVAPEGYVILKADYSNIEYRVMAIITGEKELEERFNRGENFHDINTGLLFGLKKGDPGWDTARRAAKTFIFGLSYGGTPEGIYRRLLLAVPEMEMTLDQFRKLVKDYFAKLPNYSKWREKVTSEAIRTRTSVTAFGRKRFLLGMPDEIERMALNTPIQGTAAEVALRAIIDLHEALEKKHPYAKMIGTVHDSILVLAPEKEAKEVGKLMKSIMEKKHLIEGRKVSFPVDLEVGRSWGETDKLDL